MSELQSTPLNVIANVSRVVTRLIDRLTGDRSDYPLLVCQSVQLALKNFGIDSQVYFGSAAWVEVLENNAVQWAGCWDPSVYFWTGTQFGEVIDLNTSVNYKKNSHDRPTNKAISSPPILWSREVPTFYRYKVEGVAELELTESRDQRWLELAQEEVSRKCLPLLLLENEEFPNEPILCGDRKVLDDTKNSFRLFDRHLAINGIPEAPF